MRQHRLEFTGPGRVEFKVRQLSGPAADQVLVRTRFSAISAGTEMLVYRGQWPTGVAVDASLAA